MRGHHYHGRDDPCAGGEEHKQQMTTILNDRADLHLARLHEAVTWSRPTALAALDYLTTVQNLAERRPDRMRTPSIYDCQCVADKSHVEYYRRSREGNRVR
jgi:hypothetical protein